MISLQSDRPSEGERFFHRPRQALWLGAAFLSLFVLLALLVPSQPLVVEQRWANWMRAIETPVLEHIALVFNYLGRGLGRALLLVGLGLPLIVAKRWWALLAFAVTESLTPLLSSIAKALIQRPRPPDALIHPTGTSFPSGHAAFAGATSVAIVLLFTKVGPHRRRWWLLATAGTLAMAWSRTYLQAHWLLDVLAGALLGAGVALLVFSTLQVVEIKQFRRHISPVGPRRAPDGADGSESRLIRYTPTRRSARPTGTSSRVVLRRVVAFSQRQKLAVRLSRPWRPERSTVSVDRSKRPNGAPSSSTFVIERSPGSRSRNRRTCRSPDGGTASLT